MSKTRQLMITAIVAVVLAAIAAIHLRVKIVREYRPTKES